MTYALKYVNNYYTDPVLNDGYIFLLGVSAERYKTYEEVKFGLPIVDNN